MKNRRFHAEHAVGCRRRASARRLAGLKAGRYTDIENALGYSLRLRVTSRGTISNRTRTLSSPESFTTLDPQLRQTFFIGDGQTTVGSIIQQFFVPAGATRLFLGFADGDRFQGRPAFYDDNLGSLTATFSIAP